MEQDPKIYIGIDWGRKRIGLSIADSETRLPMPLSSVGNLKAVNEAIKEEGATTVVLGAPIPMTGRGDLDPEFINFSKRLSESNPDIKIEQIDERLSSKQADSLPGHKSDKASRDEVSAMLILQTFLDKNGRDI
ncbi:Holliday junction resolvase RuvX [Candidatus Falkowbacteria bacterium]|nr:Holliday junction resolvase RuvX [Candidatus Falkowbacteria bacterium]